MSRVLFTTLPMAGHIRPLLPVAAELVCAGHEVRWYTGRKYAAEVERTGASFVPFADEIDYDDAELDEAAGDEESISARTGSLSGLKEALLRVFIAPIPAQVADLEPVFESFLPDVVVAEQGCMSGPLLAERLGIPRAVLAVSPLGVSSVDAAPFGPGLAPSGSLLGRIRNRALNWAMQHVVFAAPQRAAERVRADLGLPRLPSYFMDWGLAIADRYLLPTVEQFEYPRRDLDPKVEFVGATVPPRRPDWEPPSWWSDVAEARTAGRPVVLVTQGTVATDPANLIRPAVAAFADSDALIITTTVGQDPSAVFPVDDRPANLRVESFLPFTEVLPHVDLMITNGGYGGVQTALAAGVPLVVAGTTEDKKEVSARVKWAGVGVALRTDTPSSDAVREAGRRVLADGRFRAAAQRLQSVLSAADGPARAAEVIAGLARPVQLPAQRVTGEPVLS